MIKSFKNLKIMSEDLELPDTFPDYSTREYWETRYSSESTSYDWLLPYSQLRSILLSKLHNNLNSEILILGCGNSRLGEELYQENFHNITNIDFSSTVIRQMQEKYEDLDEMDFMEMNVCKIEYPPGCFDLIIDKSTLDCVLCGDKSFSRASLMMQNVYRVLKPGGSFVCVSYGMPDARLGYLKNKFLNWTIEHAKIAKVPLEQFVNVELSQFYYVYVCTKALDAVN
jgi:ubiquinone/menaquinone biosynthesis C-methylase UbiE